MKKILLLAATIFCFTNIINAQAGQLDPTFGNKGIVRTSFTLSSQITSVPQVLTKSDGTMYLIGVTSRRGANLSTISTSLIIHVFANGAIDSSFGNKGNSQFVGFEASAGALQTDGKIVIAGVGFDFALARYNTDGTLDTAFSENGQLTTFFGYGNNVVTSVAVQSDGKIVVAGSASGDFALARYNRDGTPDTGFSKDGKLTTDFASAYDVANSIAIQADGKIVLAGSAFKTEGYQTDFAIARYNTNGTLDTGFSKGGKLTTDFASGGDVANSVTIQADGKIVAAGSASDSRGITDFALARYNADGTPDTGFSKDGKQRTNFPYYGAANSVAIQSDGKILAAAGINVARYNTNGALDTNFSKDGKLTVNVSIYTVTSTTYTSTAIQSDGKIVMAGYISTEFTERGDEKFAFALARYNTDGTLDSSFSGDGEQTTDFESFWQNRANAVVIQSDGKIVVAGSATNPGGGGDFALARYNTDGTLDTAFSKDGKQTTDFGDDDGAQSAAIQSDGKIVVSGISSDTYSDFGYEFGDFALARYNTDGTLDTAFSKDGKQTTDFGDDDGAQSIAIQSDGKIVAAGYTFPNGAPNEDNGNQTEDLALARYNTDGTLDVSFSGDGKQTIDFASSTSWFAPFSMAIQSDGKIVAAGSAASGTNFDFTLVRCNADGTLDTSFSGDGKQTIDFGSDKDIATSVALQNDGKIIAAGYTGSYSTYNFALVRCNNNGSLDSSFSEDGKQVTDLGEGAEFISDIAISGNKLYASGYGGSGIAARYLLNGNNTPPTVTLTSPTDSTIRLAPAAHIKLSAAASDADGTITKVEFYNGTKLLHTETVIPYGFVWRNVLRGNYTITAKAYDNSGNVTTSAPVHISVVPNKAPVVSIISPANNQVFADTAIIHLEAAATDTDGRIANVKFYNGTTLLRTEFKLPYTYNWQNVPAGTYTITAVAADNWGTRTTSAPVTITVTSAGTMIVSNRPVDNKTGIKEEISIKLSPNPATNIVNLYTSGLKQSKPADISIISISGIVLKKVQISGAAQTQLDVSSLAKGVYTIKIVSGDKVILKQFVKL